MKNTVGWILGLTGLILSGCSSKSQFIKSPSIDFASFKTYAFLPRADSSRTFQDNGIIDELIQNTIAAEMNSRNYSVSTSMPDLLIQFHLMVTNGEEIMNAPGYTYPTFGYSLPATHFYFPESTYQRGTLVIGFFERSTGKFIWKGWTINNLNNLARFKQHLPDVVHRILKNYPVRPK